MSAQAGEDGAAKICSSFSSHGEPMAADELSQPVKRRFSRYRHGIALQVAAQVGGKPLDGGVAFARVFLQGVQQDAIQIDVQGATQFLGRHAQNLG